jgi:hypothetical protein
MGDYYDRGLFGGWEWIIIVIILLIIFCPGIFSPKTRFIDKCCD